ncbi:MAG: ABC transporter ATP-binding protein [Paracoccaceae bacterium]
MLEVRALSAGYGLGRAIEAVDLDVAEGEAVALLGRNGAGKSTTLKALMGLLPRIEGEARFRDHALVGRAPHEIARLGLGYVPEDRRVFKRLSVLDNLEVGRRPPEDGRRGWRPDDLFALFPNLAERRRALGGQLSGGEQQMLAIARTLMGNPRLILLDEPSEGVAPVLVERLGEAVAAMRREGLALVVSEQNLRFARAVADRAVVLETGRVGFDGPFAALDADPSIAERYLGV